MTLAYDGRSAAYQNLGQFENAISDFDRSIELDPTSALAYAGRGAAYASLGQHQRAIEDYSQAGALFHTQGQHEQAREQYDKSIALDPDYATSYSAR